MRFAPAKPPGVDISVYHRRPSKGPRYVVPPELLPDTSMRLFVRAHSLQRSNNYSSDRLDVNVTRPVSTQPHQYNTIPRQKRLLQQQPLYSCQRSLSGPRQNGSMYGTFVSQDPISRFPTTPPRRMAPNTLTPKFPCLEIFTMVIFLGAVVVSLLRLFTMAKFLIGILSEWIHSCLSEKSCGVAL